MKANPIKNFWILLQCAYLMMSITGRAVIYAMFGKLSRERANAIIQSWAKRMLRVVDLKTKVFNPYNVDFSDGKRYVIMANHSSLFDIPVAYACLDGTFRMVGKKELFKIPFFSYAMRAGEVVCIDRRNLEQAKKDLAVARERMESGLAIWMFPEGTRSPDGKLLPLKKGAFYLAIQAGAHIVPVSIRGAHRILPKHTFAFNVGETVEVHVGEPIDSTEYSLDNKEELMARVSKALQSTSSCE